MRWNLKELYENEKMAERTLEEISLRLKNGEDILLTEKNKIIKEVQKINLYFTLLYYLDNKNIYYIEKLSFSQILYLNMYNELCEDVIIDDTKLEQEVEKDYYKLLDEVFKSVEEYNDVITYGVREERKKKYKDTWKKMENNKKEFFSVLSKKIIRDKERAENFDDEYIENEKLEFMHKPVYNQIKNDSDKISSLYQRFLKEKEIWLGIERLEQFDLNVQLKDVNFKLPYDKSELIIKTALKVLGNEYIEIVEKIYKENWIDAYNTEAKMQGSYCFFVQDIHPYILINYNDFFESVLELVHEIGHAVKKYISNEAQEGLTEEIPAIVNELLFLDYLTESEHNAKNAISFIKKERILKEVIRLLMELEFTERVHTLEVSEITLESFESIWLNIQEKYYGSILQKGQYNKLGWITINWFQSYESKIEYLFANICAVLISERIRENVENYKFFLRAKEKQLFAALFVNGIDISTDGYVKTFIEMIKFILD